MQEVTESAAWNAFVARVAPRSGGFLQSWEWGAFQASLGRKVTRQLARPEEGLRAQMAMQTIEMKLPAGQRYLYCPRGPVVDGARFDTDVLVDVLRTNAKQTGAMFFRFDPTTERSVGHVWKGVRSSLSIQPADTLLTDLTLPTETLLERMHQKTRYNIRVAERKEVQIQIEEQPNIDRVWDIFRHTSDRGAFHLHPKSYYEGMLKHMHGNVCKAFLSTATYKREVIAANLMIDFGQTRTYLHGASSNAHRNVMAPFLLHWKLMLDAKEKGMQWYDWWGIAPAGATHHPWAGVTRFKLGFGGEQVHYPGTYDIVLKPTIYTAYNVARSVFRKLR